MKKLCRNAGLAFPPRLETVMLSPMKRSRSALRRVRALRFVFALAALAASPLPAPAQDSSPGGGDGQADSEKTERPETTDTASRQLIENYLTVTGGREAHAAINAVEARGKLREGKRRRSFRIIETRSGKRRLTLTWKEKGRSHERVRATDGEIVWERQTKPEAEPAQRLSGVEAEHFRHQFWLLQPFAGPRAKAYVFDYRNRARALGRPAHIVAGYGPRNIRTWFYFDRETFHLLRHGGYDRVGGSRQDLDYAAHRFTPVENVLMPKELKLLVDGNAFGKIEFTSIQARSNPDAERFAMPRSDAPMLRQKTR